MATLNLTSLSIADIEKQIEKIGAEIEKARAQELMAAEKSLATAEKAAAVAQATLVKLIASGTTTPAAKARLIAAKEAFANHSKTVMNAQQTVTLLTAKNKAAEKFTKKVAKTLAKASKGKRSKAEKKLDKQTKKANKNKGSIKKVQTLPVEQPATKPVANKVKSEKAKPEVKIVKIKATPKAKAALSKTDIASATNLPMTAPATQVVEETKIPLSPNLLTPEKSSSVEVSPTDDSSKTNIERPANNSDI